MTNAVAVAILAGGQGKRLGGGKPMRLLQGERLIDIALRGARQWSDIVTICLHDSTQIEEPGASISIDPPQIVGPLGGLTSGLKFARNSACGLLLTIPVDTPFLPKDLLQRLLGAIGDGACAIAMSGGRVHPICALWRTTVLAQLNDYVRSGRRSLMGFAERLGCGIVEWPVGQADPFLNINTLEDLEKAERLT